MKKILVLGCSGSGKSTFSEKLHSLVDLPLYHLDNIWWKEDKTHISRDEFDEKLDVLINKDSWIIDGDYSRTYEVRIQACDTIFFLDYGEEVCKKGINERLGRKRKDIPWVEYDIDPVLMKQIEEYETDNKPVLLSLFAKYPDKKVIVLRSREEADNWLIRNLVIGLNVKGKIDRPIGSAHPDYPELIYPINYGYVEGMMGGDGEEQDVYVFGLAEPVDRFEGKVIAVYHRTDDNEDKWIVSIDGKDYSDEEILKTIEFQEKYFKGELIR